MQQQAQHPSSTHGSGKRAPQLPIKYTLGFTLMPARTQMEMKSTRAHTHSITQTDMHDLVQVIIFTPETHSSSGLSVSMNHLLRELKDYREVSFANQHG